jgi:hypothetical protein
MALSGKAFIAMFHDLKQGFEQEFEAWHTYEHMPERLGVPGFLRGRRYMNWDQAEHLCFTMYEGAHIETFRSPGYLERLNNPTKWSNQIQPGLSNFLRGACETVLSLGDGIGGAMGTRRITVAEPNAVAAQKLAAAALQVAGIRGVSAVHLGRHQPVVVGGATGETALRPPPSISTFDFLLLVEALDMDVLARTEAQVGAILKDAGATHVDSGAYRLGYVLQTPT